MKRKADCNGYLSAHILRPELGVLPDHVIMLQFDIGPHPETWMQSEIRKDWIERVKPLIHEPESIKVLTHLVPWVQLPEQPTEAVPKRYKQTLLAWIGVVGIFLLVSPHVTTLLISWPWILHALVNMEIAVALLTYWVMPFTTSSFKDWLVR